MAEKIEKDTLFWSDQLAEKIFSRKKFHYLEKETPKFDDFAVKTSASISGVLHIGRLSDTIRGESVVRSLIDAGKKAKLIWVAEDMDPLRKIPEGVPKSFEQYIGMPVADVPDPEGCHDSYAQHHIEKYFQVLGKFVSVEMKKFSMKEEYKKGKFNPFIKKLLDNIQTIKEIQNKYRTQKLGKGWYPWTPVCENCGKIITPQVTGFDGKNVKYVCKDYKFEKYTAKGCGYEGEADPLKGNGKLMWKSEWAAQWARWNIVSEGAGKEYQVPNSAFWINGEISEKILNFPEPVPIFYEHIMIDNKKMSASLGNVIYPYQWLEVATPQLLRFFYNKKLMKTRSFSWLDLPNLFDEYDKHAKIYTGDIKIENKKEEKHAKRLYEISQLKELEKPLNLSFAHAATLVQIFKSKEEILDYLKKTEHYNSEVHDQILNRLKLAKTWIKKYAPEQYKIKVNEKVTKEIKAELNTKQIAAMKSLANILKKNQFKEDELEEEFRKIMKKHRITAKEFFEALYLALTGKKFGPRAASFILALGRDKVREILETI